MTFLARLVLLPALFLPLLSAQQRLTCSSDDGRRTLCPANTRGGVRLVNQRSGSPCTQGRTWGYDRRGIWVDRGCRADFVTGISNRPDRPDRPIGPGDGGGPINRPTVERITCSSDNGKRNWCAVQRNGNVRMLRQRSGSPCRRNYSWGVQPGSVWVDHGCRADFEVRASR